MLVLLGAKSYNLCTVMAARNVFYIFDKNLRDATNNIINIKFRSAAIHSLIKAYGLLNKCTVCPITPATEEDLLSFHSSTYIDYMKKAQQSKDLEKITDDEETADFNLEYDCPLFENIFDFAKIIAGGTLSAARILCPDDELPKENVPITADAEPKSYLKFQEKSESTNRSSSNIYDMPGDLSFDESSMLIETVPLRSIKAPRLLPQKPSTAHRDHNAPQKVVINWFGGWHHAQRDAAEGFCYVNDIVIGIQHLTKFYKRVLYVDLDVHHGNGVENAFAHTRHVMTVSLHKHGVGYYPGTGAAHDVGLGTGLYHSVNVPLKDGITDGVYMDVFAKVLTTVRKVYQPECVVVQCGADCLAGDPLGGFNLSLQGLGFCVQYLLDWKLPTMLLGGGGYNIPNAARCYASLTALALNEKISRNVPENDFFHLFGPSFEIDVTPTLRKNENSEDYVKEILESVNKNLENIQ